MGGFLCKPSTEIALPLDTQSQLFNEYLLRDFDEFKYWANNRHLYSNHQIPAQPARSSEKAVLPTTLSQNSYGNYREEVKSNVSTQRNSPIFPTSLSNNEHSQRPRHLLRDFIEFQHFTNNRHLYSNYQISAQPARSSEKAVPSETRSQTFDENLLRDFDEFQYLANNRHVYTNYQIPAQPARSSVKAMPPETQLQNSSRYYSNYKISAQPAGTITENSEKYLNAQLKGKSNENASEVIDSLSNLDRLRTKQFQLIDDQRKCKSNNEDKIAKLKIYSNQKTNKINLVESTVNRDFSLVNLITNISKDSPIFNYINEIFMETTQSHYRILRIEEIMNPYLQLSYRLRKKEYGLLYGEKNVKELLQFHGTKKANIEKIVNNNFDWRLHGKANGHIFGKGVSFSPISNYASNYCDKTEEKCMLAVVVLISSSCEGNQFTIIPPTLKADKNLHYDTAENPSGKVYVKFRDDEFYPQYLIYFVGSPIKWRHNY